VILYETTPTTQNAEPLTEADRKPVITKTKSIAAMANRIDAKVAPTAVVAYRCQTQRPDLPLRFVNDAHLNQTMAYLTACTVYAAVFDKSRAGLAPTRGTGTVIENVPEMGVTSRTLDFHPQWALAAIDFLFDVSRPDGHPETGPIRAHSLRYVKVLSDGLYYEFSSPREIAQ
jgi:hypothetical protein